MNPIQLLKCSLLILLVTGAGACQSDPAITPDNLIGRWEIEEAYRDGQPTETLEALYFVFNETGTMVTNLSGQDEQASYEIDNRTIKQRDSRIETDYTVQSIGPDNLELSAQIRDFRFRFLLKRSTEAIQ